MRRLLLIAGVALLGACGDKDEGPTSDVAGEDPTEFVAANDITAIDAVSGDDANMAADINYIIEPTAENGVDNGAQSTAPAASRNRPAPSRNEAD